MYENLVIFLVSFLRVAYNLNIFISAGLFALCGFYQMAVWAFGKHRNYKKEFENYPKNRKAIIPFIM